MPSDALFRFLILGLTLAAWTRGEDEPTMKNRRELFIDDYVVRGTARIEPERMTFAAGPVEDFYTNTTQSYFGAPQILVSMPFRFGRDRQALDEATLKQYDIAPSMWKGVSDAGFMTSRGGTRYDRKFMESFVRPPHRPGELGGAQQHAGVWPDSDEPDRVVVLHRARVFVESDPARADGAAAGRIRVAARRIRRGFCPDAPPAHRWCAPRAESLHLGQRLRQSRAARRTTAPRFPASAAPTPSTSSATRSKSTRPGKARGGCPS
jgi:hypothetical protein